MSQTKDRTTFDIICEAGRLVLLWFAIGAATFFFGGLAMQALHGAVDWVFLRPLLLFSLGGAGIVSAISFACWLVSPRGAASALVVIALMVAAFLLVVWPTPYKYYPADDRAHLLKVSRVTGNVDYLGKP